LGLVGCAGNLLAKLFHGEHTTEVVAVELRYILQNVAGIFVEKALGSEASERLPAYS
jgi:hypothetical protein